MRTKKKLLMTSLDILTTQSMVTSALYSLTKDIDYASDKFQYIDKFMLNLLSECLCNLHVLKPCKVKNPLQLEKNPEKILDYIIHGLNKKHYNSLIFRGHTIKDYITEYHKQYVNINYDRLYDLFLENMRDVDRQVMQESNTIH